MPRPVFDNVGSVMPGRSVFDLSYEKKLTCDMGQLIPIMCDEVVPGDSLDIGNQIVVRFQPLVAPIMHEVNVFTHYFFVPYRLLWSDWEDFITGGKDGTNASVIPRWSPTNNAVGSLWDYLGFPTGIVPLGALPIDMPRRAYNLIYNEYYRDETLINEVAETNEAILIRAWEKDYFSSALPWQQRGTAPALPISGVTHAIFPGAVSGTLGYGVATGANSTQALYDSGNNTPFNAGTKNFLQTGVPSIPKATMDNNTVDLSTAATFNVADLRLAFQIQKWMERNARAGARYTEYLRAHFGTAPRDERLQRPEYIGGSRNACIISEVLKTATTDATSPQGNLAGHGITAGETYIAKYHAQEFGVIMGIMSIMPRTAYQQGIDRQWLRRSRYDFYSPEFANLSEQAIERAELYASGVEAENRTIFGYQGRYDEMRVKRSQVCGLMRTDFNYWHLGRIFSAAPLLNQSFIECIPSKRVFAVPSQPGLVVNIGNKIRAVRPMPVQSDPGLIDHV